MAWCSFFVMWLAVLLLSLFFAACGGKKPQASCGGEYAADASIPLCVVCGVLLLLIGAGCAGMLRAGAWLVLLCGGAVGVWLVVQGVRQHKEKENTLSAVLRGCLCPAWLVTFGGSAALAVLLGLRQPLFMQWDEFSFWGTAASAVWHNDALYTLVESTNLEARTYPPALPLLSYAFSFLSDRFEPWLLYAAYGVLIFAVFGAVVGLAGRRAAAAAFGALFCVLTPFAVECWYEGQPLVSFSTSFADQMLGFLTAGGCAVWLGARREPGAPLQRGAYAASLLRTALVVAVLGFVKDVGLPLGLVVMLVCLLDQFGSDFIRYKRDGRAWLRLAGVGVALTGAAVLAYMAWAKHMAVALEMNRSETGGSAGLSTAGMLVSGIRELLGVERSKRFAKVFSTMVSALFERRVTVFGIGVHTVIAIFAVLAAALLLAQRGKRRHIVGFALASGAGFAGYWFFQLICYVYVFSAEDGYALVSYARYMGIYYVFWLLGAAAVLLYTAKGRFGGLGVAAVTCVLLAVCALRIDFGDTILERNAVEWETQTRVEQRAQQAVEAAQTDAAPDRVLVVSQWDDGGRWYRYAYALEPVPLYHAEGDNTIVPDDEPGEYVLRLNKTNIAAFLKENGCTLLITDVLDYYFCTEFGGLFADGLAGYEEGSCHVYRIEYTDDDSGVIFVPWKEAAHA